MKRQLLVALLAVAFAGTASAATYTIDANHAQVQFTYAHLGFSHLNGRLTQPTGVLEFDPAKPESATIDVTLPMASLSTGVPKLDAHLGSADFFDVAKFPVATFKSTKVTVLEPNKLSVAGDLTIHGVTRPAVLDVSINSIAVHPMKKVPSAGFDARTTIKRSEFGINAMSEFVADEVQLNISMEAQAAKTE